MDCCATLDCKLQGGRALAPYHVGIFYDLKSFQVKKIKNTITLEPCMPDVGNQQLRSHVWILCVSTVAPFSTRQMQTTQNENTF